MKLKLQTVIACFLVIASFSAKSQTIIPGYNDNDVKKLQNFFAKTDGTTTNGVKMNASYSATDPLTWTGVTWVPSYIKKVSDIKLQNLNLVDSLDVSGFSDLQGLDCRDNQITSLNVSKCSMLISLTCNNNQLTSLNTSANDNLNSLSCQNNQLTSLVLSKNKLLINLVCYNNQLKFSDIQFANDGGFIYISPQRPFIPLGVQNTNGTIAAAVGGIIDLSAEANVSPNGSPAATTFHIWKKAANVIITDITANCNINNGLITLPDTAEAGDSLFITMSNPTYPTFSEQITDPLSSSMRTCTFALIDSLIPVDSLIPPIKIYPNPATNQIYISGNEDQLNSVRIYNSFGQDVTKYTNYSISNVGQIQIDISKLDNGIYILKTKNTTNRLIVK